MSVLAGLEFSEYMVLLLSNIMPWILVGVLCASVLGLIVSALALTMTMLPGKLGDYFASSAIVMWLEGTGIPLSCAGLLITLLSLGVAG